MSKPAFDRGLAIEFVSRCVNPPSAKPTDVGLKAAFASYQRRYFESDQACFEFYCVAKPRFYEWKKTVANLIRAELEQEIEFDGVPVALCTIVPSYFHLT